MLLVNTFDLEPWWTTVPPCVPLASWDSMPDRSEKPLRDYLDLCDEAGVKATFFAVAWSARRYPERLREIVARGHEIGCHSLHHDDVATLTIDRFIATTREAKAIIEDATGMAAIAYRAPSFSVMPERLGEFFSILTDLGFAIDSSICTAERVYGGGIDRKLFAEPRMLTDTYGVELFEIPVPGVLLGGRTFQLFGGGYMRVAPPPLLSWMTRRERYQVLYLHCHDFDSGIPWLRNVGTLTNLRRRLKVGELRRKVLDLMAHSNVRSCGQLLGEFRTCRTTR